MRRLLILIALLWLGHGNAVEMYKWVDKDGRVHYSDKPPPKEAEVERRGLDAAPDTDPVDRPQFAPKPTKECSEARAALELLRNNRNVAMDLDGDGEAEVLDDAARRAQVERTREVMEKLCAPPPPVEVDVIEAPPEEGEGDTDADAEDAGDDTADGFEDDPAFADEPEDTAEGDADADADADAEGDTGSDEGFDDEAPVDEVPLDEANADEDPAADDEDAGEAESDDDR